MLKSLALTVALVLVVSAPVLAEGELPDTYPSGAPTLDLVASDSQDGTAGAAESETSAAAGAVTTELNEVVVAGMKLVIRLVGALAI